MSSEVLANILDPIHPGLSASVWDDADSDQPKLKEQHRKWILHNVHRALSDAGYSHVENWLSLVLTGSLTTYQYGPESDCDVSLFVDSESFPEWSRAEMIGTMVSNVDGTVLPGTSFPMQCFVVAPGITKEKLFQPGLRSGYDLNTDQWIQPPERDRVHDVKAERYGMFAYALEQADKMAKLLKYEPDKAVEMWHQIHTKRRRDQMAGKGDFALSNIIYKFLANRGLFKDISEASGEYIARVARPMDKQVAKFVYDPIGNRLIVGQMGDEEGENATHYQLLQTAGMNPQDGPLFGQIGANGYVETFGRPMITGFGQPKTNQYEADWRMRQAILTALPQAKFTTSTVENPKWRAEWTEPTIQYIGERPNLDHASDQPASEEGVWQF